jgi:hypothetical protein
MLDDKEQRFDFREKPEISDRLGEGEGGLKQLECGAVHIRHRVARLRMTGSILPLPLTPSLCAT